VINFKKYHSNKVFLIKSELSQLQIINEILDKYNNYRQIPLPTEIDKSCKIVKGLNLDDYIRDPRKFTDIKIYFNPNVLSYLVDLTQNMFSKQKFEDDMSLSNYSSVVDFYKKLDMMKVHNISNKNLVLCEDLQNADNSFSAKKKKMEIITKIKKDLLKCST
jgi:hypothetical protein